jgi:hypothetical protein
MCGIPTSLSNVLSSEKCAATELGARLRIGSTVRPLGIFRARPRKIEQLDSSVYAELPEYMVHILLDATLAEPERFSNFLVA